MKVLVIPEDQHLDQYILKPVVEALFAELELKARVSVLPEPRLRGASDALDKSMIDAIVRDNPMEDLFLLVVDRDCDREGNVARAQQRQADHPNKLIACLAVQEVEVWLLALYKDSLGQPFSVVTADCDPKERFADPLLDRLGRDGPGQGRKSAMRNLKGNWQSLRDTCSELRALRDEILAWASSRR